jgi:8-oxo-dGTP pyrophosphatase MutT (NUDIX family)
MTPPRKAHVERSAGGVVLRWIDGEPAVLLIRDPYRNWGLPKGHLEEGEDARQAAVREVGEETGLDRLEVGPEVATINWFFRRRGTLVHKFCTFFLMRSTEGHAIPEVGEGITEVVWLPFPAAMERLTYENARETLRAVQALLRSADSPFLEKRIADDGA